MKKAIITTSWDDGHILDLKIARLLNKYRLKGTFYISPQHREFNESELLTEQQIIKLSKSFEIGAHTMTHPLLTNDLITEIYKYSVWLMGLFKGIHYDLPPSINFNQAKNEISKSKKFLEDLVNKDISCFCYPAGRHNQKIHKLIKETGFKYARTVDEYFFELPDNLLISKTSIHANNHRRDVYQKLIFSKFNIREFINNFDWEYLAKKMFDHVIKNGGVYHLWGHSWIIQNNNDWNKLEKVFSYISGNNDVEYCTNGQLINYQ